MRLRSADDLNSPLSARFQQEETECRKDNGTEFATVANVKKLPLSLLQLGILTSVAVSQTTVVEESFTYSDGALDAVGTVGTAGMSVNTCGCQARRKALSTASKSMPS